MATYNNIKLKVNYVNLSVNKFSLQLNIINDMNQLI